MCCNTQALPPPSSPEEHGGFSAGVTARAHHHQLLIPPLWECSQEHRKGSPGERGLHRLLGSGACLLAHPSLI